LGLLRITKAAITHETQPQKVKIKIITKEPQPMSNTAKGEDKIDNKIRQILTVLNIFIDYFTLQK